MCKNKNYALCTISRLAFLKKGGIINIQRGDTNDLLKQDSKSITLESTESSSLVFLPFIYDFYIRKKNSGSDSIFVRRKKFLILRKRG